MDTAELARLFFIELHKVNRLATDNNTKVIELNTVLVQLFFAFTRNENIQFTTMFARIAFAGHKYDLSRAIQWRVHQLRKKKQAAQTGAINLTEQDYLSSLKTVAYTIAAFCKTPVPKDLKAILPTDDNTETERAKLRVKEQLKVVRVTVVACDQTQELLICKEAAYPDEIIKVKYNETALNENFNSTIECIRRDFKYNVTLNLIDVLVNEDGIYYPKMFVIEPDYLVDVSAISECFQNFGTPPELYLLKKFLPFTYSKPLMLGNIANFFLDELMTDLDVDFNEIFPKVFGLNPLVFATFEDSDIRDIYRKGQKHFANLKHVIKHKFKQSDIDPKDCFLEPSFYSEKYGLQGRLDVWYKAPDSNKAAIVELKSGKPFAPNRFGLSNNHYTQTILYDLLVRSVYKEAVDPSKYILYSGIDVDHLKFAPPLKVQQDEAIKLRNQLVAIEKRLADLDLDSFDKHTLIDNLRPELLPKAQGFIRRDLQEFSQTIARVGDIERRYLLSFTSFIAREHQLAKTGVQGKDNLNGLAALWLNSYEEKNQSFEILSHLKVETNRTAEDDPQIVLKRTNLTNPLANFRQGDIVILYPHMVADDDALTNQIFKGSLVEIDANFICVRLHCKQFNDSLFKQEGYWFVEHDVMDRSYIVQYKALYTFLLSKQHNRELILTTKAPEKVKPKNLKFTNPNLSPEQTRILRKALSAKDYFLLVGPPGTGKTKFMLAEMVRYLLQHTHDQILLMAYTNRAVDEICEAIHEFAKDDYVRIGSRYSTSPEYRDQLFSTKTENIKTRKELMEVINQHRIFVSTVASIANRPLILKIKRFDTAIIDEASQILEPILVGLLPALQRFILIGDHKQLPAVVMQDKERSAVRDPELLEIGLTNRRNSLFERLHSQAIKNGWDWAHDMLKSQGRMHEDIYEFPKEYFYDNELELLPAELKGSEWQREPMSYILPADANTLEQQIAKHRVLYFATENDRSNNPKTNEHEAALIGRLVHSFKRLYEANGRAFNAQTLGIITPFRAQIGQIRHILEQYGEGYEACTIDTVERYQGGAREIILISLCLNTPYQLDTIVSLSDDQKVDRKLNVALTRARQHLVLVGNEDLMRMDRRYSQLIDWIERVNAKSEV